MCTSLIVSKKIVVILSMGPKGGEGRGTQQGEREEKGGENDSCWVRGGGLNGELMGSGRGREYAHIRYLRSMNKYF